MALVTIFWENVHGLYLLQPCNCDVGSASLQCNATTGVCDCDPGVIGEKCDQCDDTFKGLSPSGCVSCGCDIYGSVSQMCNKTSGQCPCKVGKAALSLSIQ